MTDVFSRLVGQHQAVTLLRQYVQHPVHAYLFTGPVGSSLHDAVVTFAAALQCREHGCGVCESCRLVLSGNDPDVVVLERSGLSWRVDEIREAEKVSRRRPLGAGYQIVILDEVELTTTGPSPSAAALLKSLEEPPPRTIFLLTAEDVPGALDTIVSRCVEVRLKSLSEGDLVEILVADGVSHEVAQLCAAAAGGNLRRARVLVGDATLSSRLDRWRSVPTRLTGTAAKSAELASEIVSALNDALAPLVQLQDEELERRISEARAMGHRSVANRKEIEAQYKREQRRFRIDELRFGLSALTGAYRERMLSSLDDRVRGEVRSEQRVDAALRAIDVVAETSRRLSSNVDETLLLHDLMLSLMTI